MLGEIEGELKRKKQEISATSPVWEKLYFTMEELKR